MDKRWRIADVPIDYRDRPEGSGRSSPTFGDGAKVLMAIGALFKDYRPLAFFSWIALVFIALGLVVGVPVVAEFFATGLVPRLPSTVLAVALVFCGVLSLASGAILDTVAKADRRQWELKVYEVLEQQRRNQA